MIPFVCALVGDDTERRDDVIAHKEAERTAGGNEFWWGLAARLGPQVEAKAIQNGGTLPALFSDTITSSPPPEQLLIWDEWRSVLSPTLCGRIPGHVNVVSEYNPNLEVKTENCWIF